MANENKSEEFKKRENRMKKCCLAEEYVADMLDDAFGDATTPEKSEELAKQINQYYNGIFTQLFTTLRGEQQ